MGSITISVFTLDLLLYKVLQSSIDVNLDRHLLDSIAISGLTLDLLLNIVFQNSIRCKTGLSLYSYGKII